MSNNSSKIILTTIGILAVSLAIVFFAVSPLLSRLKEARAGIEKAELEISRIAGQIESYSEVKEQLAKVAAEKAAIQNIFPLRENMVGLVEGLEKAIITAGLFSKLTITDRLEADQKPPAAAPLVAGLSSIEEIPYILEFTGNYRGLTDFFLGMEHLPALSEISKLTITAESSQDENTKIVRNTGLATTKIEGVLFIKSQ